MRPSASKRAAELLLGFERRIKPKNNGNFQIRLKPNFGIKNLVLANKKVPEVVVKIPFRRRSNGKFPPENTKSLRNHLMYISRNGKVEVETKDGRHLSGNKVAKLLTDEWKRMGLVEDVSGKKQKLNIVLSMPKGTPATSVKNAAREFAKQLFNHNHEWVLALHTDTDEPHVHLCVSMMGHDGKRLNPRKDTLYQWRLLFAEKMQEQGIECKATRRVHRGKSQKADNGIITNIERRGGFSDINYARLHRLKEAIKETKEPTHPFLEKQLNSQHLMVKEYKILARLLYQENHKKEAREISQLAKFIATQEQSSRLQDDFHESIATGKIPERYRIYELFDQVKEHNGDIQSFINGHNLTIQEAKTLSKHLYLKGFKTKAQLLGEWANTQSTQQNHLEQDTQEFSIVNH